MQKISKGSIDADRRVIAKARVCYKITDIEPDPDGNRKVVERAMFNERQWIAIYVYAWSHKEDFEFEYKTAAQPQAMSDRQMAKLGIEVENDDDIIMKHKVYTIDELRNGTKIKTLRQICVAKGIPDDGDKKMMIDAILEVQQLLEG
jgi:hypothetical protein